MEPQIRSLKVKDCRFLTRVLKRLISDAKETWLQHAIQLNTDSEDSADPVDKTERASNIFLLIMEKALDALEGDLSEWFASLLDMSIDEYMELPFDMDMKIFRQILDDSYFDFFLRKLLAMFNLTGQSGSIIQMLKDRYDSSID